MEVKAILTEAEEEGSREVRERAVVQEPKLDRRRNAVDEICKSDPSSWKCSSDRSIRRP
jgi:hypothetical protein